MNIKKIYAEMEQVDGPEFDVQAKERKYVFKHFSRINEIKVIKTPLNHASTFCKIIPKVKQKPSA